MNNQPAVIYYVQAGRPRPYGNRAHVTQRLQHMTRRELESTKIYALDAYPEPGQSGWREVTDDFIAIDENFAGGAEYGIRLADGTVQPK